MKKDFNKYFENTSLKPDTIKGEVQKLFLDALKYNFRAVCVDGYHLPHAWKSLQGSGIMIATVSGFPLGTMGTNSKVAEVFEAVRDGAEEIDAMMNIAAIKDRRFDYIAGEITALTEVCHKEGAKLKIILETSLLTDDEIIKMCEIAMHSNVDFIRDSSGFSGVGATARTVKLIRDTVGDSMKIKASGGIRTLAQALELIEAGADRLGTNRAVDIMEEYLKKH